MTTTTSYTNVSSASQLSADIATIDLASQAHGGNGTHYTITLEKGATLTEIADIDAINLAGSDTLTINGQGAFLNGADAYRGLFAYSGETTIENLTIENCIAKGGAGAGGGGGGAGLGGGLFVANNSAQGAAPAQVSLSNVTFTNDSAAGGAGGAGAVSGGGGGGVGSTGYGGARRAGGGGGLIPGAAGGGAGGVGGGGGASGGGGGAGGEASILSPPWELRHIIIYGGGGGGGVGGAGGGAGDEEHRAGYGSAGGFGGGGGGGSHGGGGGFGGGGGNAAGGGFGAGYGSAGGFGGGGGGLGAGGDIFVMAGASLIIEGGALTGGTVTGGSGFGGGNGQAFGGGLFLQGSESIMLAPASGTVETISGVIADQTGSGGTGAGSLVISGAGTVDLAPATANTYTGGTTINSGVLELANAAAAGSGGIRFTSTSGEVEYAAGMNLANTISGFGGSDEIDFSQVMYAAGDHAVDTAGKVSIETSAGKTVATFNVSGTYASDNFDVGKDASGHVLVTDPPTAALAPANAVGANSLADLLGQPGSDGGAPFSTSANDLLAFDAWTALSPSAGLDRGAFDFPHDGNVGRSALDIIAGSGGATDHLARAMSPTDHWGRLMS